MSLIKKKHFVVHDNENVSFKAKQKVYYVKRKKH